MPTALALGPEFLAMFGQFEQWVSSDWSYLVVFAVAMIDAFFPLVPSETVVITAGVLAGSGDLSLPLVILCCLDGRDRRRQHFVRHRHLARRAHREALFGGEKSRKGFDWAEQQLEQRGTYIIVIARFIPGGRTAVTFSAGYIHTFSWRRFLAADVVAGFVWGTYAAMPGLLRRQDVRGAAVEGPDRRVRRGSRGRRSRGVRAPPPRATAA